MIEISKINDDYMYQLSELSDITGIKQRTLRYYISKNKFKYKILNKRYHVIGSDFKFFLSLPDIKEHSTEYFIKNFNKKIKKEK